MKKQTILAILFLIPIVTFGQKYLQNNEQVLFEFTTQNHKRLVIAKDKSDKYLIYRYGTKEKIELEYPNNKSHSWGEFKFSSYSRSGGNVNEGMELNYLYFQVDHYKYVVYEEYLAKIGQTHYGIKVINLNSDRTTHMEADPNSIKGTLRIFRDNEKIEKGDELFM